MAYSSGYSGGGGRAGGASISISSKTVLPGAPIGTVVGRLMCSVSGAALTVDSGPFTKDASDNLVLSAAAGTDGTVQTARVSATRAAAGDLPYLKITQDIPVMARAAVVEPPAENPFYTAAARVIASEALAYPFEVGLNPPVVNILGAVNSPVSGRSFAAGGAVPTTSVPNGYGGPMDGGTSIHVITKPSGAKTWTPGNYKGITFDKREIALKVSATSGQYLTVLASDEGGPFYKHSDTPAHWTAAGWVHIVFPDARNRVVLVVNEHESLTTFGWDFEAGATVTPWVSDQLNIQVTGDSWPYGQTDNSGCATKGQTWKLGEKLGSVGTKNGGFRTNGYVQTQGGVQCNFHDRLVHVAGPEASLWGVVDLHVMPGSINDNSFTSTIRAAVAAAWTAYRAANPNTPVFFPVGIYPPDWAETAGTIANAILGFKDVFGYTQAERDANGAHYKDYSCSSGSALIPRGAQGSSTLFSLIDPAHPSFIGHDGIAGAWKAEIMPFMARLVALGGGGSGGGAPSGAPQDNDGAFIFDNDGNYPVEN